eukprot:CFRG2806T1
MDNTQGTILPISESTPQWKRQLPLSRVIALVDLDAFYAAVAENANPALKGLPIAVTQYISYRGGAIIAVNYAARGFGVKRGMRGDDAKVLCPELNLVMVPELHGKANLTIFREKSNEIFNIVISELDGKGQLEKASIDEMFIDVTQAANEMVASMITISEDNIREQLKPVEGFVAVVGCDDVATSFEWMMKAWHEKREADMQIIAASLIVGRIRRKVLQVTGCSCSGGIAGNKMIAKLVAGFNKPNKTTLVPSSKVQELIRATRISKIRHLGAKFGEKVKEDFGVELVGEVADVQRSKFIDMYGDTKGAWLFDVVNGVCSEEVKERSIVDSIGCGKNFRGVTAISTWEEFRHWLSELNSEICERIRTDIATNDRVPTQLTLHCGISSEASVFSRTRPTLLSAKTTVEFLTKECLDLFRRRFPTIAYEGTFPAAIGKIVHVSVTASKFENVSKENEGSSALQTNLQTMGVLPNGVADSQYIICKRCEQHIPSENVAVHMDYHAAWDISRKLAHEDREEHFKQELQQSNILKNNKAKQTSSSSGISLGRGRVEKAKSIRSKEKAKKKGQSLITSMFQKA